MTPAAQRNVTLRIRVAGTKRGLGALFPCETSVPAGNGESGELLLGTGGGCGSEASRESVSRLSRRWAILTARQMGKC